MVTSVGHNPALVVLFSLFQSWSSSKISALFLFSSVVSSSTVCSWVCTCFTTPTSPTLHKRRVLSVPSEVFLGILNP